MPSASATEISRDSAVRLHHGAGRIGRAGDHHAGERLLAMRGDQRLRRQRPARLGRRFDQHRLAAERAEDVPVRRIAGIGERHAVARLEQREEGEHKAARGPGGDDDARRIERQIVSLGVMAGDAGAQRGNPQRLGVADAPGASAACAAAIAVAGADAAGWPTSMCTTRRPCASIRAAAAITSMTMNGGTSLRFEGLSSRLAFSSTAYRPGHGNCPAVAAFRGLGRREGLL